MSDIVVVRESLASIFRKMGMKDLDSNVLAELMIENREMCICDLKERLNYSTSGLTLALHRLIRNNMVKRVKRGKRYFYAADTHILSALFNLVEDINTHEIPKIKRKLEEIDRSNQNKKLVKLKEMIGKAERHLQSLLTTLKRCRDESL